LGVTRVLAGLLEKIYGTQGSFPTHPYSSEGGVGNANVVFKIGKKKDLEYSRAPQVLMREEKLIPVRGEAGIGKRKKNSREKVSRIILQVWCVDSKTGLEISLESLSSRTKVSSRGNFSEE